MAAWSYNTHHATITDMAKEVAILRIKAAGTLANNLCPDHRDKQVSKPCLACEIEKMAKRLEAAHALLKDCVAYMDMRVEGAESLYIEARRHLGRAAMQESGEWTEGVG